MFDELHTLGRVIRSVWCSALLPSCNIDPVSACTDQTRPRNGAQLCGLLEPVTNIAVTDQHAHTSPHFSPLQETQTKKTELIIQYPLLSVIMAIYAFNGNIN